MGRPLVGVELAPHGGVKSIDGDGDSLRSGFCAVEANGDSVIILFNTGASMTEVDDFRPEPFCDSIEQNFMQIGAMYRKMRIFITSIFAAGFRQNELAMSVEEREFLGLNTVIFQIG